MTVAAGRASARAITVSADQEQDGRNMTAFARALPQRFFDQGETGVAQGILLPPPLHQDHRGRPEPARATAAITFRSREMTYFLTARTGYLANDAGDDFLLLAQRGKPHDFLHQVVFGRKRQHVHTPARKATFSSYSRASCGFGKPFPESFIVGVEYRAARRSRHLQRRSARYRAVRSHAGRKGGPPAPRAAGPACPAAFPSPAC